MTAFLLGAVVLSLAGGWVVGWAHGYRDGMRDGEGWWQ